ncbi:MAG: hypothetical protein HY834_08400 [Devosia nanyangense]|uniref:Cytochrome c domain-containing protein n=1 Tax=Devosia nanyangense TaxID=1228055 RepID=A0A933NY71_9HYPH|nr:hypothetical protein [Devosia nanyangense]
MRRVAAAGLLIASILGASPSHAAMGKDAREDFIKSCEAQMYMPAPACACMADIAEQKLDDTAIAYLSLDANDVVHSAAMSKSMTSAEIASIDNFMKTAPGQCKDAK